MSKRAHAVSILLVLATVVLPVAAQGGNVIRGKVLTDQGKPAVHVLVMIESGNGQLIGQATTNNEGDFSLSGLGGGAYHVIVNEIDYQPVRERVDFLTDPGAEQPGETQYVSIALSPKPGIPGVVGTPGTVFAQNVPPPAKQAFDRGVQLSRENKPAEAVAAYRAAITAFPDYFDAHFALASELMKTNEADESMKELDRARQINPKDARVYASFGLLLAKQRKLATAAAAFGMAAQLSPSDPQYPLKRATVLIDEASVLDASKPEQAKQRTEHLAAAARDLDTAFTLSGKTLAAVHLQRARMFERMGNKKGAADELEAYLKQVPNAPNAAAIRESIAKLRS
jgi:cytochrome c-type biogenesis protein CcmH/NrfG